MNLRQMAVAAAAAMLIGVSLQAAVAGQDSKSWRSEASQRERTAPVGKVYVEGDDIPNPAPAVVASSGPRSGEQVYNGACAGCHAAGVAGAPKLGDKAAWAPRIKTGDDALWNSLMNGKNAMPPKGMCMDCSEDELKAVLAYVVDAAK
ncbi:MAG TPA: c-type cytochrome [Permianibacter sp.]|nr:c-type cytochrome [Permianibacter sp.]